MSIELSTDPSAPSASCWTCASNTGVRRLSPGVPIYEGRHWLVEHAYPVALLGWIVIVLRRHAAALHELSAEEYDELARVQAALIPLLAATLHCEKEYVACFAEGEHFRHVHFHVVPVPAEMPVSLRGARSFALLAIGDEDAVAPAEVQVLCTTLREGMRQPSK